MSASNFFQLIYWIFSKGRFAEWWAFQISVRCCVSMQTDFYFWYIKTDKTGRLRDFSDANKDCILLYHVPCAFSCTVIFTCVIAYKDLYVLCSLTDERLQRLNIVVKSREKRSSSQGRVEVPEKSKKKKKKVRTGMKTWERMATNRKVGEKKQLREWELSKSGGKRGWDMGERVLPASPDASRNTDLGMQAIFGSSTVILSHTPCS